MCRAGETEQERLLSSQVPGDICDVVSVGWRGSANGAAMVGILGYGIDNAIFEAEPKPKGAREGQRDLREQFRGEIVGFQHIKHGHTTQVVSNVCENGTAVT